MSVIVDTHLWDFSFEYVKRMECGLTQNQSAKVSTKKKPNNLYGSE